MTTPEAPPEPASLRRLVAYSLVTGLCEIIPVPLLDDWARDLMRKRQTMAMAQGYGVTLTETDAKVLACGYSPASAQGCARGCLVPLLIKPLEFLFKVLFRKILRTVLFFLTIKDVVDTVSQSLHEGFLLRHAFEVGALGKQMAETRPGVPSPEALAVRRAVEAACAEVDHRPIEMIVGATVRGSRRVFQHAGQALARVLRSLRRRGQDEQTVYERIESQGEEQLGGIIDEMTEALRQQASYLSNLEKLLEKQLADRGGAS